MPGTPRVPELQTRKTLGAPTVPRTRSTPMTLLRARLFLGIVSLFVVPASQATGQRGASPPVTEPGMILPSPVTNNAVAAGFIDGEQWVFSVLGVDSTKRWSGITRRATAWSSRSGRWREIAPVPGVDGRLAATAQFVRGRLFVFGGYTVDSAGKERSVSAVDSYDPLTDRWSGGAPMPIAVDDAVSGVYRDSLVYVISGWHNSDNVRDVQVYDVVRNRWSSATPIPGPGVFGHSGGMAGETLVFVDGAVRRPGPVHYALRKQTWIGTVNAQRPLEIHWRAGPERKGKSLYRAAAGRCGPLVMFVGGTHSPYNYDGIGYDHRPSAPVATVWAFDTKSLAWRRLADAPVATMDHRALAVVGDRGWVIGGMRDDQRVSASIVQLPTPSCDGR